MHYGVMNMTERLNMTSRRLIKCLNAYNTDHVTLRLNDFRAEGKLQEQDQIL